METRTRSVIRDVRVLSPWVLMAVPIGLASGATVAIAGPAPGLLLVAAVAALVATVRMPGTLLAGYLLIPFYKGAVQPFLPVDVTVVLAVLNTLQVVPVILDRRSRSLSRAGIVLWVVLACLVLAGVTYAPDQDLALSRAVNYWALVFIPLLPATLRVASDPRYVRQLLWTSFAMGALTVILGLAALFRSERLVVLGMNTIQTARAALLVPVVGVAFVMRERSLATQVVALLLVPGAILVAIASGSRGPLLMLLVLGALAALHHALAQHTVDRRLTAIIGGMAVVSIAIVSVFGADLPAASTERLASIGAMVEGGLSGTTVRDSRFSLYGLAVDLFEQRPLLGVGTAGFASLSPRLLGPLYAEVYPHNAVLQFAAEYGLVGVGVFVGIVLLALTRKLPRGSTWSAVRVAFLFFLLNAMVSGNILEDRTTWGLLLLLVLADVAGDRQEGGADGRTVGPAAPC